MLKHKVTVVMASSLAGALGAFGIGLASGAAADGHGGGQGSVILVGGSDAGNGDSFNGGVNAGPTSDASAIGGDGGNGGHGGSGGDVKGGKGHGGHGGWDGSSSDGGGGFGGRLTVAAATAAAPVVAAGAAAPVVTAATAAPAVPAVRLVPRVARRVAATRLPSRA